MDLPAAKRNDSRATHQIAILAGSVLTIIGGV